MLERFVTTQLDRAEVFESMDSRENLAHNRAVADEFFRAHLR